MACRFIVVILLASTHGKGLAIDSWPREGPVFCGVVQSLSEGLEWFVAVSLRNPLDGFNIRYGWPRVYGVSATSVIMLAELLLG
jgi:hypothetical protein